MTFLCHVAAHVAAHVKRCPKFDEFVVTSVYLGGDDSIIRKKRMRFLKLWYGLKKTHHFFA